MIVPKKKSFFFSSVVPDLSKSLGNEKVRKKKEKKEKLKREKKQKLKSEKKQKLKSEKKQKLKSEKKQKLKSEKKQKEKKKFDFFFEWKNPKMENLTTVYFLSLLISNDRDYLNLSKSIVPEMSLEDKKRFFLLFKYCKNKDLSYDEVKTKIFLDEFGVFLKKAGPDAKLRRKVTYKLQEKYSFEGRPLPDKFVLDKEVEKAIFLIKEQRLKARELKKREKAERKKQNLLAGKILNKGVLGVEKEGSASEILKKKLVERKKKGGVGS
jgi:hypothetical protein